MDPPITEAPAGNDPAPVTTAPAAPAPSAPANTASGAAPPAAPAAPTAPAPAAPAPPTIDPTQMVDIPMPDGTVLTKSIQEMADASVAAHSSFSATPDEAARAKLYERIAIGGEDGRLAGHALVDQAIPGAPAAPELSEKETIAAMGEKIETLTKIVEQHTPVNDALRNAQEIQGFKGVVERVKESCPYLSHNPDGAAMLQQTMRAMQQMAEQSFGLTAAQFAVHPQRTQILVQAVSTVETRLRNQAELYKGFAPPAAGAAAAAPTTNVVNDQNTVPGVIPPNVTFDKDGIARNRAGQPITQQAHGPMVVVPEGQTIPSQPLTGEPSGTAVSGAPAGVPGNQPFTLGDLKANLAARRQAMDAIGQ